MMTTTEIKKKLNEIASIIGIIIGVTMFILYVGSMQYRITNVEKTQENCVSNENFLFVVEAITSQTKIITDKQDKVNSDQNKINNTMLFAIEKNTMELGLVKDNNREFLEYFKSYTKEYFNMKKNK